MRKYKKLKAFSMLQIMGAILIAGILTAIAVPKIMNSVTKSKQLEAKTELEHLFSMEKLYYLEHSKYTSEMELIDYEQNLLETEGGGAKYKIEIIEASTTTFKASATAILDFDGDGVFNVWEINQDRKLTETVKD